MAYKQFERSEDYMAKLTMEALDNHVILDANIEIVKGPGKLKAYCKDTKTYVQFPTMLRRLGRRFAADVIKAERNGQRTFYRVIKESIREDV